MTVKIKININKGERGYKYKMGNQTYVTRRNGNIVSQTSWTRNRNTIRHQGRSLGSVSHVVIVGLLVLIVGLIYVAQGTKATNYDYELSEIEMEIADLESKKEDLAVEKARLTSIATAEGSEVAVAMEDASASGYAAE